MGPVKASSKKNTDSSKAVLLCGSFMLFLSVFVVRFCASL